MKRVFGLLAGFMLLSGAAWADPAAWYRWESRVDARLVCAQTSPGEGWKRVDGPFSNGACSRRR